MCLIRVYQVNNMYILWKCELSYFSLMLKKLKRKRGRWGTWWGTRYYDSDIIFRDTICSTTWSTSHFFSTILQNLFLDSEIYFSILKFISRFWNLFLDFEIYFSILKFISWFWNLFLDSEIYFLMALVGHHILERSFSKSIGT